MDVTLTSLVPGNHTATMVAAAFPHASHQRCRRLAAHTGVISAMRSAAAGRPSFAFRVAGVGTTLGRMVGDLVLAGPEVNERRQLRLRVVKPAAHEAVLQREGVALLVELAHSRVCSVDLPEATSIPCLQASEWHHLCFHHLSQAPDDVSLGPLLGCLDPLALGGRIDAVPVGQHTFAVFAERRDGTLATDIHTVTFSVVADDDAQSEPAVPTRAPAAAAVRAGGDGQGGPATRARSDAADGTVARSDAAWQVPTQPGDGHLSRTLVCEGQVCSAADVAAATAQAAATAKASDSGALAPSFPDLACPLRFLVLSVGLPSPENNNLVVFDDIASSIAVGLVRLGYDAELRMCPDFRKCLGKPLADAHTQVIVIGSNVLHLYGRHDSTPVVLEDGILPPHTILFNFEYLPDPSRREENGWISDAFLDVHRRFRVWDYAMANVQNWATYGVEATLAPIGFVEGLMLPSGTPAQLDETEKDIDVLFVGTNNKYRAPILHAIARSGIRVTTPAAFGDALYAIVRRAKVVLNLRSFGHDDEFKMSRLMVMFANEAFVLSEVMGHDADVGPYRAGMAMVDADGLAEAARYYLDRPHLRRQIAATGRRLFMERSQARMLKAPVDGILRDAGCL